MIGARKSSDELLREAIAANVRSCRVVANVADFAVPRRPRAGASLTCIVDMKSGGHFAFLEIGDEATAFGPHATQEGAEKAMRAVHSKLELAWGASKTVHDHKKGPAQ